MRGLRRTLDALVRDFARDLLATLRGVELQALLEATDARRPSAAALADSKPAKTPGVSPTSGMSIRRAIADTARAHGLNDRETRILTLAVRGETRLAISRALAIPENTLKTQARVLLRKLGAPFLADAAIAVLHRALGSTDVVAGARSK